MVYSLVLYYSIAIIGPILIYLDIKSNKKGIFLFVSFYLLFAIASLRYNIGTDYINYKFIFNEIAQLGTYHTEYGFLFLNKLLIFFNLPFEILILICSFFTLLFIYLSVPKKYLAMFIFLYIASNSYFQSFSLIRQSLAIAIALYAVSHINRESLLKYLVWIGFACSIHLSAILFLPIYFIRKLSVNFLYAYILIVWYIIVQYTEIIEYLFMNIVSLTPYSVYIGGAFFYKEIQIGSGLGVLFRLLIGIIILLNSAKIKKKFPEANIYLLLLFIYELSYIAALKIYIFSRLADTFSLFFIAIIPYFINSFSKKNSYIIYTIVILLFSVLMYKNLANDYCQVSGGIGVVPYQSIF